MHDALGVDLVLDEIFKNLSTSDLLSCSEVNQKWNLKTRSILRDCRHCIATLNSSDPCGQLKQFENVLGLMNIVPFNGISVRIDPKSHKKNACCELESLNEPFSSLFSVKWKYLKVDWTRGNDSCPAVKFVLKLIHERSSDLEEIDVIRIPKNAQLSSKLFLPKLKVLRVADELPLDYLARNFLGPIVQNAVNLESLCCTPLTPVQALQHLPEERLKIVRDLAFSPVTVLDEVLYGRFGRLRPKLSSLMISTPNHENDLCLENCWSALRSILKSSSKSLQLLSLDSRAAVMLLKFEITLQHVTNLMLDVDFSVNAAPIRNVLNQLEFRRLFPKLQSVSISDDLILVNELDYYVQEVQELDLNTGRDSEALEKPSLLGSLDITLSNLDPGALNYVADLFPWVSSLSLWCSSDVPYEHLWSRWPMLESLKICEADISLEVNYDAEFCGISNEEVEELRSRDTEFLRRVQIVPIRPAVTELRGLKQLHLTIESTRNTPIADDGEVKGHFKLTDVTRQLAFDRMHGLSVSLESICGYEGMEHLEPFMSFVQSSS